MTEGRGGPKIRFPGFEGEWKEKQLADILEVKTRRNANQFTKQDVLSVSDEFGCVNQIRFQGRSFAGEDISNYKIVKTGDIIYTRSPLKAKPFGIIKIVREETGIVSPLYIVNVPKDGNDAEFVYRLFDSPHKTNNYLAPLVRKGAKNTMNISEEEWMSGKVFVSVNYNEQKSIGGFFRDIDDFIDRLQRELDKWKKMKTGMLQKMFPKDGENVPKIRFPAFVGPWETRKLGEVFDQTVKYVNPKKNNIELWSLTVEDGLTKKTERYNREFLVKKEDIFKEVSPGDLVYNPMNMTIGAIGYNSMSKSIAVSGYYVIMRSKPNYDTYYINTWLKSPQAIQLYKNYATGSLIEKQRVQFSTLSIIPAAFPSYEEQKQIGQFFNKLDSIITVCQQNLEKWKELKRGLLQQMFV